jgi:hypothetical protein
MHQLPQVTSYGEMRNKAWQFHSRQLPSSLAPAAMETKLRECAQPGWCRAFPKTDCISKELDSSMSSDFLLMNIFCYPGVIKRRELCLMLWAETGDLPEFGFKPRIPLTSGFVERTEIDMKLGTV